MKQMAHTHLLEIDTVEARFDIIITFAATQAIPYFMYRSGNILRRPVGITVIGHHAAKPLEAVVFVLDRGFYPIIAIPVDGNAALVEQDRGIENRLDRKREIFLCRLHLQHRSIVVPESVIGPLPKVGMRFGLYRNERI